MVEGMVGGMLNESESENAKSRGSRLTIQMM